MHQGRDVQYQALELGTRCKGAFTSLCSRVKPVAKTKRQLRDKETRLHHANDKRTTHEAFLTTYKTITITTAN